MAKTKFRMSPSRLHAVLITSGLMTEDESIGEIELSEDGILITVGDVDVTPFSIPATEHKGRYPINKELEAAAEMFPTLKRA